jgi:hypothetical protein
VGESIALSLPAEHAWVLRAKEEYSMDAVKEQVF